MITISPIKYLFTRLSKHLKVLLLDDEVHHGLRQQPCLQVPAGVVHAPEVLPPEADEAKDFAARTEPTLRLAGKDVKMHLRLCNRPYRRR
jgi:hypothetical protein